MGQPPPRRFSHSQEIGVGHSVGDCHTMSRATVEDLGPEDERGCQNSTMPCCAVDDGFCSVEELIVVHHDGLRQVNYLLKADDLTGCELPSVPECVVAARRAELQRSHQQMVQERRQHRVELDLQKRGGSTSGCDADSPSAGGVGPCGPVYESVWENESDSEEEEEEGEGGVSSLGSGAGRRCGPTLQPSACEDAGLDTEDSGLAPPTPGELSPGVSRPPPPPPAQVTRPAAEGSEAADSCIDLGSDVAPIVN